MNGILFKLWKLRTTKIARKTYDYRKNIKIKRERERESHSQRCAITCVHDDDAKSRINQ